MSSTMLSAGKDELPGANCASSLLLKSSREMLLPCRRRSLLTNNEIRYSWELAIWVLAIENKHYIILGLLFSIKSP